MDVIHIGRGEKLLDDSFHFPVRDIFPRDQVPAPSVALKCARTGAEIIGEPGVLRVTFASVGVNEYGTGQR